REGLPTNPSSTRPTSPTPNPTAVDRSSPKPEHPRHRARTDSMITRRRLRGPDGLAGLPLVGPPTITRRRLRGPIGLAGLPLDYYIRFGDAALRFARAGWAPLRFAPACAHGRRRAHPIRPSQSR